MSGTLTPSSGYPIGNRQNGRSFVGRSSMWLRNFIGDGVWVVVLFEQRYEIAEDGSQLKNYYVKESVGIAAGLFIVALHQMGLSRNSL